MRPTNWDHKESADYSRRYTVDDHEKGEAMGYEGYTIRYLILTTGDIRDMAQGSDAVAGLDLLASAYRYRDLLQEHLETAFPGATVEAGERIAAYGPNWIDEGPDTKIEESVAVIAEDLQIRRAGEWMVEHPATFTLTTTQEALNDNFVEACWPITDQPDFPQHDELRWDGDDIEAIKGGQVVARIIINVQ